MAEALRKLAPPQSAATTRASKSWAGTRAGRKATAIAAGEGKSPASREERCEAIERLGVSRERNAVPTLVKLIETSAEPLKVREAAAVALGEIGDPEALPDLVALLDSAEAELRHAALAALAKLGDRRAVRPLVHYGLNHPHSKFLAYDAVMKLNEEAVLDLLDALNSSDPGLVLESVVLLGRLKSAKAVPVLIQVIETRSALFRSHAAESLGQIADRRAVGALVPLLKDADPGVRVNAAAALVRIPDKQCVDPLRNALNDEDEDVRIHALQALAEIGDTRAVPAILERLDDRSPAVQVVAAEALGQCGDARAVEPLLERLKSDDEAILLRAISALRRLKDVRSAQALVGLLTDERDVVRQRAVDSLGQIGDAEIAQRLEQVLKYDRSELVRASAAKALGGIGDPGAIDALLDALRDEFPVRCRAVVSLGAIRDDAALPAIAALLRDAAPEIRYHAVGALIEINPPNALSLLEPLIDDSSGMVRRGVGKALEKLGDPRAAELLNDSTKRKLSRSVRETKKQLREVLAFLMPGWLAGLMPSSARGRVAVTSVAVVTLIAAVGLAALPAFTPRHSGRVVRRGKVHSVAYGADGATLAVARTEGLVEIWDLASKSVKTSATIEVIAPVTTSPDSGTVVLPTVGALEFWNASKEKAPSRKQSVHQKAIVALAVSVDHKWAATMDGGRIVYTWDLASGEAVGALQLPANTLPRSLSVSSDGKRIATGDRDNNVCVWDVEKAQQIMLFPELRAAVVYTALSPDGKSLAVAGPNHLSLFSLETKKALTSPKISGAVWGLSFSPKGTWLALVTNSQIQLVTPNADQMKTIAVDDAERLETFAISPDEKTLATGCTESSKVWVCDLESGEVVKKLDVK